LINWFRKYRRRRRLPKPHNYITTWQLFRRYLESKLPTQKQSAIDYNASLLNSAPKDIQINHIAIILDGRVEEIIRAQNRLSALLLSDPVFVEFDPTQVYPKIGITEYRNEEFVDPIIEEDGSVKDV
jgi:hypothetical protein